MNATHATILELRSELAKARSGGDWGQEMLLYLKLLTHPALQWSDLLDALGRPECLSETPAIALHLLLGVPRRGQPNRDREFWEGVLKGKELECSAAIATWISMTRSVAVAWAKLINVITPVPVDGTGTQLDNNK
jgi:hypothetical protein